MERKVCAKSQSIGAGPPGNYLLTVGTKLVRGHEKSARVTTTMKLVQQVLDLRRLYYNNT